MNVLANVGPTALAASNAVPGVEELVRLAHHYGECARYTAAKSPRRAWYLAVAELTWTRVTHLRDEERSGRESVPRISIHPRVA